MQVCQERVLFVKMMAWSKRIFGIEFVQTTPMQALEAICIMVWSMMFGWGAIVLLFVTVAMLWTPLALVSIAIWLWTVYDRNTPERGGRRCEWVRTWSVWKLCRNYFPISLHRTVELDPARNYLFLYHPHGILSYGAFSNFATNAGNFNELFPGMKSIVLGLKVQFMVPLIRELFLAMGKLTVYVVRSLAR